MSLICGVRAHGIGRMRSVWKHERKGADSVHTGVNVYAYTLNGRTDIPVMYPGPDRHGRAFRFPGYVVVFGLLGAHEKRRVANYILSRGGVVVEITVSRDPRRVALGYDFTFRVLLGSLMMGCRSERWAKGKGEADATGDRFGAGTRGGSR